MVITFTRASATECAAFYNYFALEIDSFLALSADHAGAFEARQIFRLDFDFHPLLVEKDFVGEFRVGFLLAGVLAEFRKHFAGSLLGRFSRGDTHGTAGLQVADSGANLAPITEFQHALSEAAVGGQPDGR